jgi:hypothetical protein
MRNRGIVFCVVILLATAAVAADKRVHQNVALAASGSVSIDTHNGTITVTTWNQPSVDVSARIEQGLFISEDDVNKTEVRVTGSGENVRIESDYSAIMSRFFWWGNEHNLPPVHYTLFLPATARLTVDAHNATVRATGLRNDIKVTTHNGDVDLSGLDGAASIETHNGDIHVAFTRLARLSRIETHNGGIDLRIPSRSQFRLDASGHHLGVNSDFPVVMKTLDRSRYVGDVNGGGAELRVTTHRGSVTLKKV